MHSVLVFVKKPKSFSDAQSQFNWNAIANAFNAVALKHPSIEMLGESCMLVPMSESAELFADALRAASCGPLPYRILFFEEEPDWVASKPE